MLPALSRSTTIDDISRRRPMALMALAVTLVPLTVLALPEQAFEPGDDIRAEDFRAMWNTIRELEAEVAALKERPGTVGPEGKQGPIGPMGAKGDRGPSGLLELREQICAFPVGAQVGDCFCGSQEVAVGGGGWAALGAAVLRESRPIGITGWRLACADANGARADCREIFVLCAKR